MPLDDLEGSELQPISFADFSLTGTDYRGQFLVGFDIAAQYRPDVVESDAEGAFPTYVRTDPNSKVIPLAITLLTQPNTQAMLDALKTAFSPSRDIDYLRVMDANGNTRRVRAKSLGLVPYLGDDQYNYVASLAAPEPVWELDTASMSMMNVSGSTAADVLWEIDNPGNEECFPVITVTPYANRGGDASGTHQLAVVIAWRSSLEGVDSQGFPYPIELTDGGWDYPAAEDAVGDGSDVQVWADGVEISRYAVDLGGGEWRWWCSIPFQPARIAYVASDDVTEIQVLNPDDLAAFPDVGFIVADGECIAYRGKSAGKFLNCLRTQRGTSAGTLSPTTEIYWVEHDVRITWGDDGVTRTALDADERPMFRLAISANDHHYYEEDGLIDSETLRPGQWIRELRATANNRRTPYSSLTQVSDTIEYIDQLPAVGAPNFDSLSLYTPCLVSSNVTGVAFDSAVDHLMALSLYGVDSEGFESLIHRRDCLGWVVGFGQSDGVAAEPFLIGDAVFATRELLPAIPLARLTFSGYTGGLTGIFNPNIASQQFADALGQQPAPNHTIAQTLRLARVSEPRTVTFAISPFGLLYAAYDGLLVVGCVLPEGEDIDAYTLSTVQINPADLPPPDVGPPATKVVITVSWGGGTVSPMRFNGQLAVQFSDGNTATDGAIPFNYAQPPRYPSGDYYSSADEVDWVKNPSADWYVYVADAEGVPQDDADMGTGFMVQLKNVDVHFDSAFTPLIVLGAPSDCYILTEEVLENTDTGETLTLTGVLPIADIADDIFKIDASGHVVTVLTDQVGDYEQSAGYALDPSDIQHWIRLLPGLNHFRLSNVEGAPRLAVRTYSRARWT